MINFLKYIIKNIRQMVKFHHYHIRGISQKNVGIYPKLLMLLYNFYKYKQILNNILISLIIKKRKKKEKNFET